MSSDVHFKSERNWHKHFENIENRLSVDYVSFKVILAFKKGGLKYLGNVQNFLIHIL